MEKTEFIKDSVKRILGMSVMILVFVIGILALYFSSLLIGQQETLKTSEDEFIIYLDEGETHKESSETDSPIVVLNDDNLTVREVKPLSPTEGVL